MNSFYLSVFRPSILQTSNNILLKFIRNSSRITMGKLDGKVAVITASTEG